MSVEQQFKYTFNVVIVVKGTPTKKNSVRDGIIAMLQTAKTAGNIESGTWEIKGEVAPEGGTV